MSRPPQFLEELPRKPMFRGLDVSAVTDIIPINMSWDYIRRLRDIWPRKLIVKGIVTREDAELAVVHGLDRLVVSNHGGPAEDSGFSRGTDIFKALALGATAVGIGRRYL